VKYYFDWDPSKAKTNLKKHKVGFELAATIFLDPLAVTIYDKEHSEGEDRWVTVGTDRNGTLLVVVHTFQHIDENTAKIRIISVRKATRKEAKQHREENK
jgi:uncharacterized protein